MTPVEEIAFAPIQSLLGSAIQSTVRKDRIEIFRVPLYREKSFTYAELRQILWATQFKKFF